MPRRLTRNRRQALGGGVAAGFGDYFDVDPVLVRLGFVLLALANGNGVLLYLICWVIMPASDKDASSQTSPGVPGQSSAREAVPEELRTAGQRVRSAGAQVVNDVRGSREVGRARAVLGFVLIGAGAMLLLDRFSWMFLWPHWLRFGSLWPLVLVAIGVALLLRSREERA